MRLLLIFLMIISLQAKKIYNKANVVVSVFGANKQDDFYSTIDFYDKPYIFTKRINRIIDKAVTFNKNNQSSKIYITITTNIELPKDKQCKIFTDKPSFGYLESNKKFFPNSTYQDVLYRSTFNNYYGYGYLIYINNSPLDFEKEVKIIEKEIDEKTKDYFANLTIKGLVYNKNIETNFYNLLDIIANIPIRVQCKENNKYKEMKLKTFIRENK